MSHVWWIALLGVVTSCAASEVNRVANSEYKFSVSFQTADPVCTAMSGDHPHGFFVRLDPGSIGCDSPTIDPEISAISIYAYGNSTFEQTPEEEVNGLCRNADGSDGKVAKDSLRNLAFSGRPSAACENAQADGSIDIYVVTQAGSWSKEGESSGPNAPYVNYTAALHTTPKHLARDLPLFRLVVKGVRIDYPK